MTRSLALMLCSAVLSCGKTQPAHPTPPDAATLVRQRPYLLSGPPGAAPAPLVVALHGFTGGGAEIGADLGLTALAAQQGFWLALPDGTVNSDGYGFWNATTNGRPPWDREYLAALIDDVAAKHAIDPKRIYLVGYSNGAFMAHRLACDLGARIAAVVSLAGAVTTDPAACAPGAAVSVLEIHGDRDEVITYDGSPFVGNPPQQTSPSAHDTVGVWARNDGCTGGIAATGRTLDLDNTLPGPETKVEAYSGCPAGFAVELWTIQGGGHGPDLVPGFAATIDSFLQAHPRP